MLGRGVLGVKRVTDIVEGLRLPLIDSVDLVQGDDEGGLLLLQKLKGFKCLFFKTVHNIDNKNGKITQRRTS